MALYLRGKVYHYDFFVAGRRYRGTTKQRTLARARRRESDLIAEATRGALPDRKAPLLSELATEFLRWVDTAGRLSKDGQRYYRNGWRLLKDTRLINMRIDAISSDDLAAHGPSGGSATVNNAVRTLRRMLGKAVEWGMLRSAPKLSGVREHGRVATFDESAISLILDQAPQPLRDVFVLLLDTGMRPAEVFRMRWEHVDWLRESIFVPFGKTHNARRVVPLTTRCKAALLMRRDGKTAGWVFSSKRAKGGHSVSVAKQWITLKAKLNLNPELVLYSARHTFGTKLYAGTGNLKLIMQVMGHGDVKTAMRYQHPEVELARKAIEGVTNHGTDGNAHCDGKSS